MQENNREMSNECYDLCIQQKRSHDLRVVNERWSILPGVAPLVLTDLSEHLVVVTMALAKTTPSSSSIRPVLKELPRFNDFLLVTPFFDRSGEREREEGGRVEEVEEEEEGEGDGEGECSVSLRLVLSMSSHSANWCLDEGERGREGGRERGKGERKQGGKRRKRRGEEC